MNKNKLIIIYKYPVLLISLFSQLFLVRCTDSLIVGGVTPLPTPPGASKPGTADAGDTGVSERCAHLEGEPFRWTGISGDSRSNTIAPRVKFTAKAPLQFVENTQSSAEFSEYFATQEISMPVDFSSLGTWISPTLSLSMHLEGAENAVGDTDGFDYSIQPLAVTLSPSSSSAGPFELMRAQAPCADSTLRRRALDCPADVDYVFGGTLSRHSRAELNLRSAMTVVSGAFPNCSLSISSPASLEREMPCPTQEFRNQVFTNVRSGVLRVRARVWVESVSREGITPETPSRLSQTHTFRITAHLHDSGSTGKRIQLRNVLVGSKNIADSRTESGRAALGKVMDQTRALFESFGVIISSAEFREFGCRPEEQVYEGRTTLPLGARESLFVDAPLPGGADVPPVYINFVSSVLGSRYVLGRASTIFSVADDYSRASGSLFVATFDRLASMGLSSSFALEMPATIAHELGHLLGLHHTQERDAQGSLRDHNGERIVPVGDPLADVPLHGYRSALGGDQGNDKILLSMEPKITSYLSLQSREPVWLHGVNTSSPDRVYYGSSDLCRTECRELGRESEFRDETGCAIARNCGVNHLMWWSDKPPAQEGLITPTLIEQNYISPRSIEKILVHPSIY